MLPLRSPASAIRSPSGLHVSVHIAAYVVQNIPHYREFRFQHSADDGKDLTGQRNRCPLRSLPLFHLPVPTGKVQLAVRCHAPCDLAQHALQIGIAFVDMDALPLTCALVIAGTQSRPGTDVLGILKNSNRFQFQQ